MGNLSPELRAVLKPASGTVVDWAANIAFPGANLRLSMGGYSALGLGHYAPRILNVSPITYQVSDRSGSVPALEISIDVADPVAELRTHIEGVTANEIRGTPSTLDLVALHPTITAAKWFRSFTGILAKPSYPGAGVVRLTLRVDDITFNRKAMQPWRITRATWPAAKADVMGKAAPAIYGEQSAANHQTGPGLIPTMLVDTLAFRYLVCAGYAKSINRVYANGVAVSGWTLEYLTRGGRVWTVVKFSADQGDSVITVDMYGVETVGDGSGTLITSKALQHAHFLTNFVFGDWKSGAWLSTSARIDGSLTGAIASFLAARGGEGSLVVDATRTPDAVVAALCNEESFYARWTHLGTLAFGFDGIFADAYATEPLDWYSDDQGDLPMDEQDIDVTSGIQVQHVPSISQGTFLSSFLVEDLGALETAPEPLDLTTSAAK